MVRKKKSVEVSRDAEKLNSILVENFVNLQKVVTNLATKFEDLSDNISKLLQLFEISARSFSEKLSTSVPEIEKDREFLDKLNRLLDQNKTIAKGLTIMEDKLRERVYGQASKEREQMPQPPAPTRFAPRGYLPSTSE